MATGLLMGYALVAGIAWFIGLPLVYLGVLIVVPIVFRVAWHLGWPAPQRTFRGSLEAGDSAEFV